MKNIFVSVLFKKITNREKGLLLAVNHAKHVLKNVKNAII